MSNHYVFCASEINVKIFLFLKRMQYKVKGLDSMPQEMEKPMKSFKQARNKIRSMPKKTTLRRNGETGRKETS